MGAGKFGQIGRRQAALDHVQAGFAAGRRRSDHSNDSGGHQVLSRGTTVAKKCATVKAGGPSTAGGRRPAGASRTQLASPDVLYRRLRWGNFVSSIRLFLQARDK